MNVSTYPAAGEYMGEEKSLLRWGGLAGMLGGLIFILIAVILVGFAPLDPADPEGSVMRFPDVRAAVALGESLYLVSVILWVTLFLALYRTLRGTSLAPALFGSGLGLLGLVVFAAGALPHVAFAPISDLYHAPGATPGEKATLVLVWQGTQGIFNELDTSGFLFITIGFIVLGVAMLKAPAFGKGFGGVSMALGAAGVAGISVFGVDSFSFAPFAILVFIIFPLLIGWKVYSLSRAP
jgi:hypothetical protein